MISVRARTCLAGSVLAVAVGVVVDHGGVLGADQPRVALLGLAAGAALGLVPGRNAAGRLASFAAGFVAVMVGLSLLRTTLPDIPMGRALAAVVVVAIVTAVATASADRLPLWAGLLGAVTMTGAFQTMLAAHPEVGTGDTTTVVTAATTALLPALLALVLTQLINGLGTTTAVAAVPEPELALPTPRPAADPVLHADTLLTAKAPR